MAEPVVEHFFYGRKVKRGELSDKQGHISVSPNESGFVAEINSVALRI
jgi:hypothetical protein